MPFITTFLVSLGISKAVATVITTAVISVASGLGTSLIRRLLRKKNRRDLNSDTQTITGEINPRRWIIGTKISTPGVLNYWGSSGPIASMGLIVGEGSLSKIRDQVKIDGKSIKLLRTADPDGDLLVPLAGSEYEGKIEFREYFRGDGSQGVHMRQDPPPATTEYREPGGTHHPNPTHFDIYQRENQAAPEVPFRTPFPEWTAEHRLEGVSWVYVKLIQPDYGNDIDKRFWTGTPNIEFLIEGLQITWPGQTTPVATENAAAIRYWWETVRRGRDPALIDAASFAAAYALCNQDVDATNGGVNPLPAQYSDWPVISKRYTVNGVITAEDDIDQVEDQLDAAWAGEVIESGGKLYFRPGVERTAVLEINDADIIAAPIARPWPSLQERITSVTGELPQSTQHDYSPLKVPEIPDVLPPDVLDKAGSKRAEHIVLSFVNDPLAAGRLLSIILRRGQERLVLNLQVRPGNNFEFVGLIPTDIVLVTNSEYGLVSQRMIVERIAVRSDGRAELTLREDIDGTYNDDLIIPALPERIIRLPDNSTVPSIEGFNSDEIAAVSNDGTVVIYLVASWTGSAIQETEVQIRRKTPQGDWETVFSPANNARFPGVVAGETYELQARHWNRSGVAGEWSDIIENTVDGDLTPPAPVHDEDVIAIPTGFHLIWENPDDPDFGSACIYMGTTNSFAAATLIATVDADYYQSTGLAAGQQIYLWIRAKDRSGNLSAAVGPIIVTPNPLAEGATLHLTEASPPPVGLGNDGDVAINSITGEIFDKINGAWEPRIFALTPVQGLTGEFETRSIIGVGNALRIKAEFENNQERVVEVQLGYQLAFSPILWFGDVIHDSSGASSQQALVRTNEHYFTEVFYSTDVSRFIRARFIGELGQKSAWNVLNLGIGSPNITINRFDADVTEIQEGESATLIWETTGATEVRLGIFGEASDVVDLNGSLVVSPTQTTIYHLVATDGGIDVSEFVTITVTVTPPTPQPFIVSFTADDSSLSPGETTTIRWQSRNALSGTITGPNLDRVLTAQEIADQGGAIDVGPFSAGNQNYEVIVAGAPGTQPASRSLTISVSAEPPPDPVRIVSYSVDDDEIESGESTIIRWQTENATAVTINGTLRNLSGTLSVSPTSDTDYVLRASGPGGPVSRSVSVSVSDPPPPPSDPEVISFSASDTSIEVGQSIIISWATRNGDTRQLVARVIGESDSTTLISNASASGNLIVTPSASTIYRITVWNAADPSNSDFSTFTITVSLPTARITSFTADDTEVPAGTSVRFEWETEDCAYVNLQRFAGFGSSLIVNGGSPNGSASTTVNQSAVYRLFAFNADDQLGHSRSIDVDVI